MNLTTRTPAGAAGPQPPAGPRSAWWTLDTPDLLAKLGSGVNGLSSAEAARRLASDGPNTIARDGPASALAVLRQQFAGPLVLLLVVAAAISAFVGELRDAAIIIVIVATSGALGFTQEYRASKVMSALRAQIAHRARAVRDGQVQSVAAEQLVRGDILDLSAGDLISIDGALLEATDLQVSEAALTGESFPVAKRPGKAAADAPLSLRANCVFAGTSVRSGTARVVVAATGEQTEYAAVASSLARAAPETDFERGLRRFGYLMLQVVVAMLVAVFVVNLMLERPLIDSLLFSMALSVGLTPELLPAIVSVTLARGARTMSAGGVIVRRLHAIENLGAMDTLCTDKTGTLTEGVIRLDSWLDPRGVSNERVLLLGRLNASLQAGMKNPLDDAIGAAPAGDAEAGYARLDEIPYDFVRRRLSVLVSAPDGISLLICKGAVDNVLEICTQLSLDGSVAALDATHRERIQSAVAGWSMAGFRALAVAERAISSATATRDDERDMVLAGFLLFFDPPKAGVVEGLSALTARGIAIKVISGDNRNVVAHLAGQIGLAKEPVLTGAQLSHLTRAALAARVEETSLFAEIDPNQKERIIAALRSRGHVVGYLGDGINDAPALHEADVGISVDTAVDVAREAADMILMQRDLNVLVRGVDDGRAIFANTMKYVFITTSANFGNMISMALASAFLPFLPLLAKQILLNNLLSDVPCLAIAGDRVESDELSRPQRWNIALVRRFMIRFGLLSSLFDLATFAFLILLAGATETAFQTGWFVESLLTEIAIVFVVRTRRRFWTSKPSLLLIGLSAAVAAIAIVLPYSPLGPMFDLEPLHPAVLAGLVAITLAYVAASELFKRRVLPDPARAAMHRPGRRRAVGRQA